MASVNSESDVAATVYSNNDLSESIGARKTEQRTNKLTNRQAATDRGTERFPYDAHHELFFEDGKLRGVRRGDIGQGRNERAMKRQKKGEEKHCKKTKNAST